MSLDERIQRESERFHVLFDRLSNTQWSGIGLSEAQAHFKTCQEQARIIQDKIDTFNAAANKEYKRLENIKGHGVRHAWYKIRGKLEQRLDEQEATWLREFEKCKEAEERLIVLTEQINTAQQHLQQCQVTYEEYMETKRALDGLFEHFFAGVTPSYPEEDIMEQNLKRIQEHLTNLQNQHYILSHVFHLLKRAHQAIVVSRRALDNALNMNTFDLFSNSSFADMAVHSHLAEARNASSQAQQLLNEARSMYPNMPYIGDLYIQQDNLVFNIMFDNIWTDMNMRQQICEASNRMSRADAILTQVLSDVKQKLDKCNVDRDNMTKRVKQLAGEHFNARMNIVRNIIDAPPPPYSSIA